MSGTIYRLITPETETARSTESRGTVRDARKLALATKTDVDLWEIETQPGLTTFVGRVLYARSEGFRLHERIYGTYYTRGIFAELLFLWRDTLGRVHFQSPIQSPFYLSPRR
jgi:hypothetical protein